MSGPTLILISFPVLFQFHSNPTVSVFPTLQIISRICGLGDTCCSRDHMWCHGLRTHIIPPNVLASAKRGEAQHHKQNDHPHGILCPILRPACGVHGSRLREPNSQSRHHLRGGGGMVGRELLVAHAHPIYDAPLLDQKTRQGSRRWRSRDNSSFA